MAKKPKNDLNKINNVFKKGLDKIKKPIDDIGRYFKCGINKIKSLGDCILFYIIDMFIAMYFLLWNMFATVFGLKNAGQSLWKFINKYQKFKYPKSIMKKCYLC